jgi:hypothetical protein
MLIMNLWIFTLSITILWGLFIIVKIHAYKFKNFSYNIGKVTNILLFFLLFLTVLWYSIIILSYSKNIKIDFSSSSLNMEEVHY